MIQSPEFPPHSRMGLGRAYSAGLKDGVVAKAGRSFTSSLQYCEVVLMRGVMPCCVFKNRPPNITLPLSCEWLMVRFVCVCVCVLEVKDRLVCLASGCSSMYLCGVYLKTSSTSFLTHTVLYPECPASQSAGLINLLSIQI